MTYPPQQPPYGYPAYGAYGPPPEHPQATMILILGILGLVFCQILGPVAWVMGRRALNEIDAAGGALGGRSNVMVGYVCGIIASVMIILGLLFIALFVVLGLVGVWSSSSY
ncbi:hypothetical protein DFR70_104343 [Nocardia tenerifensis]|uniref:DUF4190 domain-containing protein n=1 Tax=Nocardia tenerifensis TaxID=228006 RepID=A0A318K350_9NOCA|nr:hypothetical protein [Nocardia tenerifensis]PXX65280.1 hypothetical protein DFR70_104343 [Nocardia tenerifensis]